MSTAHLELVQALGHDKGNLSRSLQNLEAKDLVRIARTSGGKAEAVDLTTEGRRQASTLTGSCE